MLQGREESAFWIRGKYERDGLAIPLFDDIVENLHHGRRLLFCEALLFKALYEFERVEVMIPPPGGRGMERSSNRGVLKLAQ